MKKIIESLESLVPLDLACLAGIKDGRAKGKPHYIKDSPEDLALMAAEELRDARNYTDGRLDQADVGPRERECLIVLRSMIAAAYHVAEQAREYQRRGE